MRKPPLYFFPTKGIYVSALLGSLLYGFPRNNSGNEPPFCSVPAEGVNDFGVDGSGNLIVPQGMDGITVWEGPQMCGDSAPPATITDPYGEAADASAVNALTGNIAVANLFGVSGAPGSISICTVASGTCSTNLTNPNMNLVAGVAMSTAGDCWANALNPSGAAVLVYFAGCTGSGQLATGFTNGSYGGVDIDRYGNLVTTSLYDASGSLPSIVSVYSGCNPACTLRSATALAGESIYGHVGKQTQRYVTTDLLYADVEVYRYRATTGLSLNYSFTGSLPCATDLCEAAAYDPNATK
ncbi:MAG TPA: hypothetical protein VGX91_03350 [Candidatus Cybelea sp.]|jgi:hypothetical protein|nr:hypothetical protein [Candidatus Cybelea sp.]